MNSRVSQVVGFESLGRDDVALVGGKNANLGELCNIQNILNIQVPSGFALTTELYREFIKNNKLADVITSNLDAYQTGQLDLCEAGENIRQAILSKHFNPQQQSDIVNAYSRLCETVHTPNCDVAVRSSATVEDLPEASFAGQQDSFLNVRGNDALLTTCLRCFASLYTDRAIAYRQQFNIASEGIAISVGIQKMVHSNSACSGVIFTLDTETGFPHAVLINASWGLGDSIVNGSVVPDRYSVFKPLLSNKINRPIIEKECGSKSVKSVYLESEEPLDAKYIQNIPTTDIERNQFVLKDDEIILLANWATAIERVYGQPMDIEWAKDGLDHNIYIVQARAETIESRKDNTFLKTYHLKQQSDVLVQGDSIGKAIVSGEAFYMANPNDIELFPEGAILITEQTDPDWVPVIKKAKGIVTDLGGVTSHAAIVSRELQVPAVVGTGNATKVINTADKITLDCASDSKAKVYSGCLAFDTRVVDLNKIPSIRTEIMLNIAIPEGALRWWQLPTSGIGLTRIEYIMSKKIKVHPMALIFPSKVKDKAIRSQMAELIRGYQNEADFFVQTLSTCVAKIAASCYPKPAIVRCSNFDSSEYRELLGSQYFARNKEKPDPGLSRYQDRQYREAFMLECKAIKQAREVMGFENVVIMLPYCSSISEADDALALMGQCDLYRGQCGLQIYMTCKPTADIEQFAQLAQKFDGICIDLNEHAHQQAKTPHEAYHSSVKEKIASLILAAHKHSTKVGLSMQTLKYCPDFETYLVSSGIDSISLNPEVIAGAIVDVAAAEAKIMQDTSTAL